MAPVATVATTATMATVAPVVVQRKTSHPVLRSIMIALNIAFYGSALAGGIKLLHDLPQHAAPAVTAPAPQSAPQSAPSNASPASPSLPSSAPQIVPGDTPPTVSSPSSPALSEAAQQLPRAQYVTIQALDGTRADHLAFARAQW